MLARRERLPAHDPAGGAGLVGPKHEVARLVEPDRPDPDPVPVGLLWEVVLRDDVDRPRGGAAEGEPVRDRGTAPRRLDRVVAEFETAVTVVAVQHDPERLGPGEVGPVAVVELDRVVRPDGTLEGAVADGTPEVASVVGA